MAFCSKEQIVSVAHATSPFYQKLYESIQWPVAFENLPVATLEKVQSLAQEQGHSFLNPNISHGICFSSSGTTGVAKASFFDMDEWKINNSLVANMHWKTGVLRDHDVIVNLAYAGHASFMAVHDVIQAFPGPCSEITVGADRDFAETIEMCEKFNANVITGVYSTFLGLSEELLRSGRQNPRIRWLLGGGELLYGAQAKMIKDAFPNAEILPFIYGSTDAGLIGYGDGPANIAYFRVFEQANYVEIVDKDSHQVIREAGKPGMLVLTNLLRKNSPVVRYCNGDWVQWLAPGSNGVRRFEYLGRMYTAVDVAEGGVSAGDVWDFIGALSKTIQLAKIQVQLSGTKSTPEVIVYFATYKDKQPVASLEASVAESLALQVPFLRKRIRAKHVDFSFFSSQIRKRGKLLVDEREH